MQYTIIDKFKNFAIQHRVSVVIFLCTLILGVFAYVFNVSYSRREKFDEFSEIQDLIDNIKRKDKGIYNDLRIREVKRTAKGIDVSSWQGEIDWEKVKNSGVEFVIIRCGFRNLNDSEYKEDRRFKYNISEANKYGIPAGVYFYSTAKDEKEALEEASFVLNLIKDYDITYPVVYDFEAFGKNRTKNVSYRAITNNALTFLTYIEQHGYNVMLYTNLRAAHNYWKMDKLDGYKIWYAQYIDKATYEGEYEMWQYSDTGRIDGIKGYVDLDEAYITYEVIN